MRDLPTGAALVALGRARPRDGLAPSEHQRELHLLATALAIAERETMAGDAPTRDIRERLVEFYGRPDVPSLHRLASDLRAGAFERCDMREPAARAILWRLTILKLREGNPQFLAANGFGE